MHRADASVREENRTVGCFSCSHFTCEDIKVNNSKSEYSGNGYINGLIFHVEIPRNEIGKTSRNICFSMIYNDSYKGYSRNDKSLLGKCIYFYKVNSLRQVQRYISLLPEMRLKVKNRGVKARESRQ